MKIAIYGAGGVGGYFGGRLAQAGADVHLIARGSHLEVLQENGITVESVVGDFTQPVPATDDPHEIGPCDYVFVCVKSYDTESVAVDLDPLLADDTAVVSLQNGVDNEEKLADALGETSVLGGVAYIFSTIKEPGVIEHSGGPARIVFGELDGTRSDRATALANLCERADGMDGVLSGSIQQELWRKYAFICAQAGVTAAIRRPIGDIRETEESWDLFRSLLDEVVTVATAAGVAVPDTTTDEWVAFARELEPTAYSSLHYDMVRGNRMELEALHGTVVRKAADHDVSVPCTETIYAILKPWAVANENA